MLFILLLARTVTPPRRFGLGQSRLRLLDCFAVAVLLLAHKQLNCLIALNFRVGMNMSSELAADPVWPAAFSNPGGALPHFPLVLADVASFSARVTILSVSFFGRRYLGVGRGQRGNYCN